MKVIVLHGQDTTKSYARLSKFMDAAKDRGWEIIQNEFPETPSLFGTDRLIVFRDYHLVTDKHTQNFSKYDGTLVIYYDGEIPIGFLKKMPKDFKLEKFDVPKILFTFLEHIYPGNTETVLKLLHALVLTDPVELVFFFLAKHLRDLYWVLTDPASTGFPGWKQSKLKSQASKFSEEKLKIMIGELTEIDISVKTSKSELLPSLDLMLIRQLK